MSIASVVTEGFGQGASIALVVTSGFGAGEAVVVEPAQPQPEVQSGGGPMVSGHRRKPTYARRTPDSGRYSRIDSSDGVKQQVADLEAARRKLAEKLAPPAPVVPVVPPRRPAVHDAIEIRKTVSVSVKTKTVVEIVDDAVIKVRGRGFLFVRALAVRITVDDAVEVSGHALVETQFRGLEINHRSVVETLRIDLLAAQAELKKARQDREALEVLLLAA